MRNAIYAAGTTVAIRQGIAVILVGLFVLSMQPVVWGGSDAQSTSERETASSRDAASISLDTVIAAVNLLVAVGLIATSEAELKSTAHGIKKAARLQRPTNPLSVVEQLVAMTGMAALGSAAMAFSNPPANLASIGTTGTSASVLAIVWSGFFSVAFAFFAATARAALKSRQSISD